MGLFYETDGPCCDLIMLTINNSNKVSITAVTVQYIFDVFLYCDSTLRAMW